MSTMKSEWKLNENQSVGVGKEKECREEVVSRDKNEVSLITK